MVHLHLAGYYTALYIIQNFKPLADIDYSVRFFSYQEKTLLHIHSINKDPLESSMVKNEESGRRVDLISRLRSNNNLFDLPGTTEKNGPGRPRKYGDKLGTTSSLAAKYRDMASEYMVNLYGRKRSVLAYDRVVMLKTLKCAVHGCNHFAFSDVIRSIAKAALADDFSILCPPPGKPVDNSVGAALLRLVV